VARPGEPRAAFPSTLPHPRRLSDGAASPVPAPGAIAGRNSRRSRASPHARAVLLFGSYLCRTTHHANQSLECRNRGLRGPDCQNVVTPALPTGDENRRKRRIYAICRYRSADSRILRNGESGAIGWKKEQKLIEHILSIRIDSGGSSRS